MSGVVISEDFTTLLVSIISTNVVTMSYFCNSTLKAGPL